MGVFCSYCLAFSILPICRLGMFVVNGLDLNVVGFLNAFFGPDRKLVAIWSSTDVLGCLEDTSVCRVGIEQGFYSFPA